MTTTTATILGTCLFFRSIFQITSFGRHKVSFFYISHSGKKKILKPSYRIFDLISDWLFYSFQFFLFTLFFSYLWWSNWFRFECLMSTLNTIPSLSFSLPHTHIEYFTECSPKQNHSAIPESIFKLVFSFTVVYSINRSLHYIPYRDCLRIGGRIII